jgi:hypothetical protein
MKIIINTIIFVFLFIRITSGIETVGSGALQVILEDSAHGVDILRINNNSTNMLEAGSEIFTLNITQISSDTDMVIGSVTNWADVQITNNGTSCEIIFSDASAVGLPGTLTAVFTVNVIDGKSAWDLSVSGLGTNYSLINVVFPELKIKAAGNDYFLLPKYSGKAVPDPLASAIDYRLFYPRGWAATMQFFSYYNNDYGLYLGFHDPYASIKTFVARAESGYLKFAVEIPAADKSVGGNDWSLPGVFELDVYSGGWYEAAAIYKEWVFANAGYRPQMTPARIQRQNELGKMGVWGYFSSDTNYPMSSIQQQMTDFVNFFPGIPAGIHWYQWNYEDMDDNYPDYFPERSGMIELVSNMQASAETCIMPYINGRLYDTELPDYSVNGYPCAAKQSDGSIYYQNFNGSHFAVECPSQSHWQDILVDVSSQIVNRIDSKGVYIDQVCAASPVECMATNHNHTLGGGHYWRDGYKQMFDKVHTALTAGRFVTVEGGDDYMVDEVDGFLTDGWTTDYLVPAFQTVYGDRVQFFGTRTGTSTYNNQSFYCKLAQSFVNGIQPGRFSLWIVHDSNAGLARPFVRNIAAMHYKLREFLAFGCLQKPLSIAGNIPDITSVWTDYGTAVSVTISAIQSSVYKNRAEDSVAIVMANASMTNTISCSFAFSGADYGLYGDLNIRSVTEESDGVVQSNQNSFIQSVQLAPMKSAAYIIKERPSDGAVFSVSANSREVKF